MNAYLYFDLSNVQRVLHLLGEPTETRPLWVNNEQTILLPPWYIHTGYATFHLGHSRRKPRVHRHGYCTPGHDVPRETATSICSPLLTPCLENPLNTFKMVLLRLERQDKAGHYHLFTILPSS